MMEIVFKTLRARPKGHEAGRALRVFSLRSLRFKSIYEKMYNSQVIENEVSTGFHGLPNLLKVITRSALPRIAPSKGGQKRADFSFFKLPDFARNCQF